MKIYCECPPNPNVCTNIIRPQSESKDRLCEKCRLYCSTGLRIHPPILEGKNKT